MYERAPFLPMCESASRPPNESLQLTEPRDAPLRNLSDGRRRSTKLWGRKTPDGVVRLRYEVLQPLESAAAQPRAVERP